jgi:hypothetical protein
MDKFLQAKDDANRHCVIMSSHNVPRDLVNWIWVQHIKLKQRANLSEVKLERMNVLNSIGSLFRIYDKWAYWLMKCSFKYYKILFNAICLLCLANSELCLADVYHSNLNIWFILHYHVCL